MKDSIHLGVDFGSTGIRVAYLSDDGEEPVPIEEKAFGERPFLLCEPVDQSALGVSFPALKSKLGRSGEDSMGSASPTVDETVTDLFRTVRQVVEEQAQKPIGQAVLTVPALYSASQRSALRRAAERAGLGPVHFINDALAAVIAQTSGAQNASTLLVYSMGYAGFELGLVRAARGHFRALGHEGGKTPAGWAIDQLLLEVLLRASEEKSLPLDTRHWDGARWLELRAMAQRVKESLTTEPQVSFPFKIRAANGRKEAVVTLTRQALEEALVLSLQASLDQATGLLEQSGMALEDISHLLLVGGSTRLPILRSTLEKVVGKRPLLLDTAALARGAAMYAAQLPTNSTLDGFPTERLDPDLMEVEVLPSIQASVTVANGTTNPSADDLVLVARDPQAQAALEKRGLGYARRLIEEGRSNTAREFLENWIEAAQAMLKDLPQEQVEKPTTAEQVLVRRALARAYLLLEKRHYHKAIQEAHAAWNEDRDDPDVFEKMIDIHCRAAAANNSTEGYENALRWLQCAFQHDEGNTRVRRLIADRHFLHARHLAEGGRRKEALEVIGHCLVWNPEHQEARELQRAWSRH